MSRKVIKFNKNGGKKMQDTIRIKPILPTPTLTMADSEAIIADIIKPISSEVKSKLKSRREMMLRNRVK